MRLLPAIAIALLAADVRADDGLDLENMIVSLSERAAEPPPRFAFTNDYGGGTGSKHLDAQPNFSGADVKLSNVVTARSADGAVAWIAADAKGEVTRGECAPDPCPPNTAPPLHATGVVERIGKKWQWVAWHITAPVAAKKQARVNQLGVIPDPLPRAIAGAEEAVKVFEASIGDPSKLAATVSPRADVVLYGSEASERTVGGAKVKAKLVAWKLAFKVRDGVQAGLAGTSVAWVAANVDATTAKDAKGKPSPYRVLALYEKSGATWALVQAHFSVDAGAY